MSVRLYDLTEAYRGLLEVLDAADGEVDANLDAQLATISDAIADKVEGCLSVARHFDLEAQALEQEIKRLEARKKTCERNEERLREYVKNELVKAGIPKLRTTRFTVSVRQGPPSLRITDETAIAEMFVRFERVIDKAGLKKMLLDDVSLRTPGAELVEGKPVLTVR